MQKSLTPRETDICRRLRSFREGKRISRTAFALAIGIGGERLASYEAARVPLRYEVFRCISEQFRLNPYWLATGGGSPELAAPIKESAFAANLKPRALFSEVYDRFLLPQHQQHVQNANQIAARLSALLKEFQYLGIGKEQDPCGYLRKAQEGIEQTIAALRKVGTAQDNVFVSGKPKGRAKK